MAEATVKTRFWQFTQNNSGGVFHGPARHVLVEATSETMAQQLAGEYGVDEDAPYCRCCGRRWNLYYADSYEVPSVYGDPIAEDYKLAKMTGKVNPGNLVLVVYMNGKELYYEEK